MLLRNKQILYWPPVAHKDEAAEFRKRFEKIIKKVIGPTYQE
jgi:hypothetical protein